MRPLAPNSSIVSANRSRDNSAVARLAGLRILKSAFNRPPLCQNGAQMRPKTDSVPNSDMLQANKSVIVLLVAVLTLTLVAVLSGLRAAQAEAQARERLWNAYIDEARAMRAASQAGRRQIALTVVSNAASISRSPELRTEAIACLALSDLVQEGSIAPTPRGLGGEDIDATLTRFAYGETNGNV